MFRDEPRRRIANCLTAEDAPICSDFVSDFLNVPGAATFSADGARKRAGPPILCVHQTCLRLLRQRRCVQAPADRAVEGVSRRDAAKTSRRLMRPRNGTAGNQGGRQGHQAGDSGRSAAPPWLYIRRQSSRRKSRAQSLLCPRSRRSLPYPAYPGYERQPFIVVKRKGFRKAVPSCRGGSNVRILLLRHEARTCGVPVASTDKPIPRGQG